MSKLVKINDVKPIEIYIGRKTRGPISGIRLSTSVIGRILRSVDAPRDMYAIGPNNKLVKLTLENYTKTEEELFNTVKPQTTVNTTANDEAKLKAEALRKSLEAKKLAEANTVKPQEVKSEVVETKPAEETVEIVNEPEVQATEAVETKVEEVVETKETVEETTTEEAKESQTKNYNYNNYNKNYNKNNKNRK